MAVGAEDVLAATFFILIYNDMKSRILKQRLQVKRLQGQWDVLSARQDLSAEQREIRCGLDKKLMQAKLVLVKYEREEGVE